jgi:hypothetical protein
MTVTANLPEPLPHGVLAGQDVLASRTAELARQQQPAVVWQRVTAAGIVPAVRSGVLIAGELSLDIRTGHARTAVPAVGGSSGYRDGMAGIGIDQSDGSLSWTHLASAGTAVVLTGTGTVDPETVVAVHDQVTGRRLWEHRWPDRTEPGTRAADVRGGAVLTREGAFIRARRLLDGQLLWSAVPPPRYDWFGDAGRHPASQWARLPHPGAADLFIHAPTGQALSIGGVFHQTGDDLVLTYDGHTLTCLALPGSPHRPALALESAEPDWLITVSNKRYLPPDGNQVSAIATVTMTDLPPPRAVTRAQVFLIDVSAAMDETWLAAAREAVAAALDRLRTGTLFAIIAGAETASMVYPPGDQLTIADPRTLAEASRALGGLTAGAGRIAVGRWLRQARLLLQPYPEAIRQAQLLVAGISDDESTEDLAAGIAQCEGVFRCDCRGMGTNWSVSQLRRISSALLGTLDIVIDPRGLAADVAALTDSAMARTMADLRLRLRPAEWARVRFVRQVDPAVEDLTGRRTSPPGLATARDYPTGAWQPGESRDYHIGLEVTPGEPDVPMQACLVSAVLTDPSGTTRELAGEAIQVEWVAGPVPMDPHVAHYTGQAELAQAIQDRLAEHQRNQHAAGSGTEASDC